MDNQKTVAEWEIILGQQLRDLRIRQNIEQRQLAERAGVAWSVLKRLESGKGTTVTSLIRVLRALERVEWLSTLAPVVSISPLQMLKEKPKRQRATRSKGARDV